MGCLEYPLAKEFQILLVFCSAGVKRSALALLVEEKGMLFERLEL